MIQNKIDLNCVLVTRRTCFFKIQISFRKNLLKVDGFKVIFERLSKFKLYLRATDHWKPIIISGKIKLFQQTLQFTFQKVKHMNLHHLRAQDTSRRRTLQCHIIILNKINLWNLTRI